MKKTVIVTGASRGIGRAISLKLAADGFAVVAAARGDAEKAAEYVGELQKLSPESVYVSADISSEEDRRRLVDTAFDRFGGLDILVNNAGVAPTERRDILEMTEESMQRLLDINLKGTFFLTQYAANDYQCHIDVRLYGEHQPRGILHLKGGSFNGDGAVCRKTCGMRHQRV